MEQQQLEDRRPPDHAARREARVGCVEAAAAAQAGLVTRRQLGAMGVHPDVVRRRLAARVWAARSPTVVSLTTGPSSVEQLRWLAVLNAPGMAALAGRTALAVHGLRGWESSTVSAIVAVGDHAAAVPGIDYHRTRRPFGDWSVARGGLPVLMAAPAALLTASRLPDERSAAGVLAAVVQQRLASADVLGSWLERLPRLRRSKRLAAALDDISGGAQSVAEIDLGAACEATGLEPPVRQTPRLDSAGNRRWTDAEWVLPDGTVVVLEVDGGLHMDVEHWSRDKQRHRRLSGPGRIVVSCTAYELRTDPRGVMADLRALGVPTRR